MYVTHEESKGEEVTELELMYRSGPYVAVLLQNVTDLKWYEYPVRERGEFERHQDIAPPLDGLEQFVKFVDETLNVGHLPHTPPPPQVVLVVLQLLKIQEVSVR